jgi:hypothetical protein
VIAPHDPALPVALRAAIVATLEDAAAGRLVLGQAGSWRPHDPVSYVTNGSALDEAERGALHLARHLGLVTTGPGTGRRRLVALTPLGRWQLDCATAHLATFLGSFSPLAV